MNGPGDIPLTQYICSTPDTRPCSLVSIIPTLGMSSCRGRAEAFARRLSSKLRTLGSQSDDDPISQEDEEPIMNGGGANSTNTWLSSQDTENTVTDIQPLRHESDSFFDFDCELESPGSPVDECEYLRLIETASNTPHNSAAESGYVCASAASSHSSSDGPYFDVLNNDNSLVSEKNDKTSAIPSTLLAAELPEYVNALKLNGSAGRLQNGHANQIEDSAEETPELNITETTETELNSIAKTSEELQITGPDVTTAEARNNEHESELSPHDMVRLQYKVLQELQQQSEDFVDSAPKTSAEPLTIEHESTALEMETVKHEIENETKTADSSEHSTHAICNGQSIHEDEEILKIEITQTNVTEILLTAVENDKQQQKSKEETQTEVVENKTNESKLESTECEPCANNTTETQNSKNAKEHQNFDTTEDEDDDDCRPQRVRRCSSLKTGKTPPGTPGRKKIVRFADVLGLDLADVKTFLDEIPTIPKSAFEDLEIMESEPPIQLGPKADKMLMPLFQQPGGLPTFLDMVREKQVSLENAAVTDSINQTITGSVRVRNLDFHKSVHIRYTLDGWRSFADLQANYVENSCDGFSDKFTFVLFGNSLHVGQRLELAVRFQCKGQQFWDNNYGANYCFQCLPTATPTANPHPIATTHHADHHLVGMINPAVSDAWCSSFYWSVFACDG